MKGFKKGLNFNFKEEALKKQLRYYLLPWRILGLGLLIVSLGTWFGLDDSPQFVETYYSRWVYPFVTSILAFIGSLLPLALTGLIFTSSVIAFVLFPVFAYRKYQHVGWGPVLIHVVVIELAFAGILLFLAIFTFILNHQRLSELELYDLPKSISEEEVLAIYEQIADEANELHQIQPIDKDGCSTYHFQMGPLDKQIEKEQQSFLLRHGLPAIMNAETKYFLYGDVWLGLGVAGQYQPLVGQPNIPPGLPNFHMPFVIAHERGHLNGFASEAGATLLALQTMLHSQDLRFQYLARLRLLNWKTPPENINDAVLKDIECMRDEWKKVKRYRFKEQAQKLNDYYLKMSGHKDGIKSYGRGTALGLRYYQKHFMDEASAL